MFTEEQIKEEKFYYLVSYMLDCIELGSEWVDFVSYKSIMLDLLDLEVAIPKAEYPHVCEAFIDSIIFTNGQGIETFSKAYHQLEFGLICP